MSAGLSGRQLEDLQAPASAGEPQSVRDAWDAYLRSQREAQAEPEAGL